MAKGNRFERETERGWEGVRQNLQRHKTKAISFGVDIIVIIRAHHDRLHSLYLSHTHAHAKIWIAQTDTAAKRHIYSAEYICCVHKMPQFRWSLQGSPIETLNLATGLASFAYFAFICTESIHFKPSRIQFWILDCMLSCAYMHWIGWNWVDCAVGSFQHA